MLCPRRRQHSHLPRVGAFSLIELLIVLFILALIGTIVLPRFSQFSARQRVEAAARRIVADLRYAQRRARSTGTQQKLAFDLSMHAYTLNTSADPDHSANAYNVPLMAEPYWAKIVSADFGGDPALTYDAFGAPDSGGSVVVAVGAYQKTVSVELRNGRASTN